MAVAVASAMPSKAPKSKRKLGPAGRVMLIVAGIVASVILLLAVMSLWQYHLETSGPYAAIRTDYKQMIAADKAVVVADISEQHTKIGNDIVVSAAGTEKRIALHKAFDKQVKALQFPASKNADVTKLLNDEAKLEQILTTEEADLNANNISKHNADVTDAGVLQGAIHDDVQRLGTL